MPATPNPQLWADLLAALRHARGHNGLRGLVLPQPDQGRIVIEVPPRGAAVQARHVVVQVGPYAATVVAQLGPTERLALTDLPEGPDRLARFVARLALVARGGAPYALTADDRASYKPGFRALPPR